MTIKNTYKLSRMEYMQILNKNLEIRHKLADIMPYLAHNIDGKDLEKYQEFFKFTEKLDKRFYFYD